MKNRTFLTMVIAAVLFCILVMPSLADMGAPEVISYDVVVNPGGAATKDGSTIPEGTVLTINFEYEENGVLWGGTTYNGNRNVYVDMSCVSNGDTIPEDAGVENTWNSGRKLQVYSKEGAKVYAGPGQGYKVVFNIPCGEIIIPTTMMASWEYVEYGDGGGWIMTQTDDVVDYLGDSPCNVWILEETDLYSEPYGLQIPGERSVICKIPADVKTTATLRGMLGYYYVTYGDYTGWIQCRRTAGVVVDDYKNVFKATSDGTVYLFEAPFDYVNRFSDPAGMAEIKKDEYYVPSFVTTEIADYSWAYIEIDDTAGWTPIVFSENDMGQYPYSSNILERQPITYEDYLKLTEEQSEGETEAEPIEDTDEPDMEEENTGVEIIEEGKEEKTDVPEGDDGKVGGFFDSPTAIIVFSAVCAVIVALVAAVVLGIIKKKKEM